MRVIGSMGPGTMTLAVAGVVAAMLILDARSDQQAMAEAVQSQQRALKLELSRQEHTLRTLVAAEHGQPFEVAPVRLDADIEFDVSSQAPPPQTLTLSAYMVGAGNCSLTAEAHVDLETTTVAMLARTLTCGGVTRKVSGTVRADTGRPIEADVVATGRSWQSLILGQHTRLVVPRHTMAKAWLAKS